MSTSAPCGKINNECSRELNSSKYRIADVLLSFFLVSSAVAGIIFAYYNRNLIFTQFFSLWTKHIFCLHADDARDSHPSFKIVKSWYLAFVFVQASRATSAMTASMINAAQFFFFFVCLCFMSSLAHFKDVRNLRFVERQTIQTRELKSVVHSVSYYYSRLMLCSKNRLLVSTLRASGFSSSERTFCCITFVSICSSLTAVV